MSDDFPALDPIVEDPALFDRATINYVLEIFPTVDIHWLEQRSTYPATLLVEFLAENFDFVPHADVSSHQPVPTSKVSTQEVKKSPVVAECGDDRAGTAHERHAVAIDDEAAEENVENAQSLINSIVGDALLAILQRKYDAVDVDHATLISFYSEAFEAVKTRVARMIADNAAPMHAFVVLELISRNSEKLLFNNNKKTLLHPKLISDLQEMRRKGELIYPNVVIPEDKDISVPAPLRKLWDLFKSTLKEQNSLFESSNFVCPVCSDVFPPNDAIACRDVEAIRKDRRDQSKVHRVCIECARGIAKAACDDAPIASNGTGLNCVEPDCKRVILRADVIELLDKGERQRLTKRLDIEAVRQFQQIEHCTRCTFAMFIENSFDNAPVFDCQNPTCLTQFCRQCKRDWTDEHVGKRCDEMDKEKDDARKKLEEDLTLSIVRVCKQCNRSFQKQDGCNLIHCSCGNHQCYVCSESGISYNHFQNGRCSQNTTGTEYDAERTRRVRDEARRNPLVAHIVDKI